MPRLGRRDFLKVAAITPAALAVPRRLVRGMASAQRLLPNRPNIIFLVFDTLSAYHVSLYGYPRRTMPNLERFAERATVYHAHYSPANFTVPGTATMLTGLEPWTHRALHLSGLIDRDLTAQNIFRALGGEYHRFAFSQNVWATNLLAQFRDSIDQFLPSSAFSDLSLLPSEFFPNDRNTAHQIDDNVLFDFVDAPGSLMFGVAQRMYFESRKKFDRDYPRGIPQPRNYPISYRLEHVFDGIMDALATLPNPFFAYIHIFSPHAPYRARKDFIGIFDDGYAPIRKPEHVFTEGESYETIEQNRIWYEEYIANVDHEFGRLVNHLEDTGLLDNTYLLLTSDHGELLERGVKGHVTPLLYEPLMRVPLVISAPGQTSGAAIRTPTSSVDLVPTLLKLAGRERPSWAEGNDLPGLGGNENHERPLFMLEAKSSPAFGKLSPATFAVRRGSHKIILYHGYEAYGKDVFELYDLENDPEELNNLFDRETSLARQMRGELMEKLQRIDRPYES